MLRLGKRLVEVGGEERRDIVLARRRVEQVPCERGVKNEPFDGKVVFEQRALEVLDVVADFLDIIREQGAQQRVPVALVAAEAELGRDGGRFACNEVGDHAGKVRQRQQRHVLRLAEEREIFLGLFHRGHGLGGHGEVDRLLGGGDVGGRLETVFVDELGKFQLHKERIERV